MGAGLCLRCLLYAQVPSGQRSSHCAGDWIYSSEDNGRHQRSHVSAPLHCVAVSLCHCCHLAKESLWHFAAEPTSS